MAYASIPDLYLQGFREEARGDLTDAHLAAALDAASTTIDGFLGQRYGQPLATWTPEITRWTVVLAVFELMTGPRGVSDDTPDYQALLDRRTSVLDFLKRAQRQDYHPVGLTPVTAPAGTSAQQPLVISFSVIDATGRTGTNRGW